MSLMTKTIVITGTHLTPALAVIKELQKNRSGHWRIYYLGRRYTLEGDKTLSSEFRLLPQEGVKFFSIPAGRLQRRFTRWTIPSLLRVPQGFLASLKLLKKIKPDIICSFGGYVSVPVVMAGKILGIPSFTHEQTITVGLANRINGLLVDRIAITFPQSQKFFPRKKTIITGNPIREEIFQNRNALYQFPQKRIQIYFTGGSQGASSLNQLIWALLPKLTKKYNLIHQCGGHDYPKLKADYQRLPKEITKNYFLIDYIGPRSIGWALNSDLIVGRSGANTILEIAALGKPAILIPLPKASQEEQLLNARFLTDHGGAVVINQENLTKEKFLNAIEEVIDRLDLMQKQSQKLKGEIELNAAQKIVDQLQKLSQ